MKDFIKKEGALTGLIILIIIIGILNPNFLSASNILNLFRQISINSIIAFGMTFVILTGGIDLSVGSILALSSVFVAKIIHADMNIVLAIILGLFSGAILGSINGFIISYANVAPFIVTLSTMSIYRGLTLVFTNGNPISNLNNKFFRKIGSGYILKIPIPFIIMLFVFLITYIILQKMPIGRKIYAIGGNEKVAKSIGIQINKIKVLIYTISGIMASLSGIILTSRLASAQPTAGTSFELDAIAAVVLGGTSLSGGKGKIFGTFIGALIIGVLSNGLNTLNVSSFYQSVVKGIVILIAVLLDRKNNN